MSVEAILAMHVRLVLDDPRSEPDITCPDCRQAYLLDLWPDAQRSLLNEQYANAHEGLR